MSDTPHDPGQQFVVDAHTHHSLGHSGFVYAHIFTDLASRQVYPSLRADNGHVGTLLRTS